MDTMNPAKEMKQLYHPSSKEITTVTVPAMNFVMIDGIGDPNGSQTFRDAVEALFGVSYTVKFMLKKRGGFPDYSVMPLEGLWWADDMERFNLGAKELWKWTLMIAQPEFVTAEHIAEAVCELARRKNPPALSRLRFERFDEGLSAQILHIGPYAEEGPAIARLRSFITESGRSLRGKHHEIYLSDMRRTAPGKLKTVLRQPME